MPILPTAADLLARARADLRMGLPVAVRAASGLALAAAAETVRPEVLPELLVPGSVLAITRHRAETLNIPAYDGDGVRLRLAPDTTAASLAAIADPADDLKVPMKGPFRAERGGDPELARAAVALMKGAHLLPAAVLCPIEAVPPGLTLIDLTRADMALAAAPDPAPVVSGRVPLAAAQAGRVHVFRMRDGGEEHYAVEIGAPPRDAPVLTRLHSACFTGDVLGSLKCDCGPQLHAALAQMGEAGAGVLLYLNQEGRGIGLANKMRAYALQDEGFDTVEANHRLGFEDDERDFRLGAAMLRRMGFSSARLMTNNPAKVEMLENWGIEVVERVPLKVGQTDENARYLRTKAEKSGHLL